jgi:hypothetical protein
LHIQDLKKEFLLILIIEDGQMLAKILVSNNRLTIPSGCKIQNDKDTLGSDLSQCNCNREADPTKFNKCLPSLSLLPYF